MKKLILITIILAVLTLSACTLEGDSPNWDHLQDNDPTKLNRDTTGITDTEDVEVTTDDPRCNGQYTVDDIINRDLEMRAKAENVLEFCLEMPDEPLVVSCPDQITLIYYSKARCIDALE